MRHALLIGIDSYEHETPLVACVSDVRRLAPLLAKHGNGEENFKVDTLVSDEQTVTEAVLTTNIMDFFEDKKEDDVLCLYFAGHGVFVEKEKAGYLVAQDGRRGDWGLPMEKLIVYANGAGVRQVVIMLDCCHAGAVDNSYIVGAPLGDGVCILAGARDREPAVEGWDGGVFTSLIEGALAGGGADPVTGKVTVANVHSFVDGALGDSEQCPLLKGNIATWCTMREMKPIVPPEVVSRITTIFPDPMVDLPLNKNYEPTEEPKGHPKEAVFADLQKMRDASLVKAVGEDHLYWAAMRRKSCALTPLGRYYWMRVKQGKFHV